MKSAVGLQDWAQAQGQRQRKGEAQRVARSFREA
jgi:hypothetical protein